MKSFLRIFLIFTLLLSVSISGQYAFAKESHSNKLVEQAITKEMKEEVKSFEKKIDKTLSKHHNTKQNKSLSSSTDSPVADFIDPSSYSVSVPIDKIIVVTFNKDIKMGNGNIVILDADSKPISFKTEIVNGKTLLIKPDRNFTPSKANGFGLAEGAITDSDGNGNAKIISAFYTSSSTVGNVVPVTNIYPKKWVTDFPYNDILYITYAREISIANAKQIYIFDTDKFDNVEVELSTNGNTLFIKPKELKKYQEYMVKTGAGGVADKNGISNAEFYYSFTTNGQSAETKELSSINVSQSNVVMSIGESTDIKVTANYGDGSSKDVTNEVTFTSDDESVVSVNNNTLIAEGEGTAVVTVEYQNQTAKIKVTVSEESSDQIEYTVIKGQTIKLKLSGGNSPYKAVSDASKIASAKIKNGYVEIKGVSEGTATITVTDGNKKEVDIVVDVVKGTIEF